jgi:hypothetical protein
MSTPWYFGVPAQAARNINPMANTNSFFICLPPLALIRT